MSSQTECFGCVRRNGKMQPFSSILNHKKAFAVIVVKQKCHSHFNSLNLEERYFLSPAKRDMSNCCDPLMPLP